MQITSLYTLLLLCAVTGCKSFFLDSKDIKRLLKIFPKAFDVNATPKISQPLNNYRQREPDYRYRDEYYVPDYYDRKDSGDHSKETTKFSKEKLSGRYDSRRSQASCDHPDHHHHHHQHQNKYENAGETHFNKHREEGTDFYFEKMKDEQEKKIQNGNTFDGKNGYDKQDKKDYITGVLIRIPKLKQNEDIESFYKNKKATTFLQQLLKTDVDEDRINTEAEDVKEYLY